MALCIDYSHAELAAATPDAADAVDAVVLNVSRT
jgi:hypothetical protein